MATMVLLAAAILQPPSLLQQIVPNPTGKNGYEELLMAVDSFEKAGGFQLIDWKPEQLDQARAAARAAKEKVDAAKDPLTRFDHQDDLDTQLARIRSLEPLEGQTSLQVKRSMVARGKEAYALLLRGLEKPVRDPRLILDLDTPLPEFSKFRQLGKFLSAKAWVEMSEGKGLDAAATLSIAYRLSRSVSTIFTISRLVSASIASDTHRTLETLLPMLPEKGLEAIDAALAGCLTQDPLLAGALETDLMSYSFYAEEISKPTPPTPNSIFAVDPDFLAIKTRAQKLPDAARQQLGRQFLRQVELFLDSYRKRLQSPESEWSEPIDPPTSGDQAIDAYVASLASSYPILLTTEARTRTQLRVARAALRIVRYRWNHEKLPQRLADAMPPDVAYDPLMKKELEYVPGQGGNFRIFSKGVSQTGEIGLNYRAPRNQNSPAEPS